MYRKYSTDDSDGLLESWACHVHQPGLLKFSRNSLSAPARVLWAASANLVSYMMGKQTAMIPALAPASRSEKLGLSPRLSKSAHAFASDYTSVTFLPP